MSPGEQPRSRSRGDMLGAVSAGFFLLLIGLLFVLTPNLYDRVVDFFRDIITVNVTSLNIMLPVPASVSQHMAVYSAVVQFDVAWGIISVAMLVLRFITHSSTEKKVENVGDIVFWLGAAYLVQTWLIDKVRATSDNAIQTQRWFEYWALLIMLIGVSLVVRAVLLAAARVRK